MKVFFLAISLIALAVPASQAAMSDADIRQGIIRESLAGYPGPCPCPYNRMRNGRSCGNVSAYVRPGGYSPICYDRDITADMIRQFKAAYGE
ncbi:MAG: hypothetical protein V4527_13495 [Pseudomonadota bacterium]